MFEGNHHTVESGRIADPKFIRLQRIIFETARDVFDQMAPNWAGDKGDLLGQLISLTERYLNSDCVSVKPESYGEDEVRRRTILVLSMNRIVQHLFEGIRYQSTENLQPVFDIRKPIVSTVDAGTWYTGKACERFRKNHINLCVFDSTYEKAAALELDRNKAVVAWAKNDHLNFEILYFFKGVVRKYIPDFIVQLDDGTKLILEVKGQETDRDRTKWAFLNEWCQAVNTDGRFGKWTWDVSYDPAASDVSRIIELAQIGK